MVNSDMSSEKQLLCIKSAFLDQKYINSGSFEYHRETNNFGPMFFSTMCDLFLKQLFY